MTLVEHVHPETHPVNPSLAVPVLAGIVARLRDDCSCRHSVEVIEDILQGCLSDLSAVPTAALPELLERLARVRLNSGWASWSAERLGQA
jgi:hypothetical protein